tara:strand:- start:80 stop:280 length:201 start_codon:yes stop_codon:yes gene_type:complete
MRNLTKHSNSNNTSFGFNILNDKQRSSICGLFDFLHCSINEDGTSGKVLLRDGELIDFKLSLIGVK